VSLPDLTHLQFLILAVLMDGERSGRFIRDKLKDEGAAKSGPAFYQLMARMEDAKLVEGWYTQKIVEGQIIKERRYRVTGAGVSARNDVRDFYIAHARRRLKGGLANA
jgi:DNA-binding PadR family transcriptional regulator